jgi:predicted DNA-binding mobile mystery protein A
MITHHEQLDRRFNGLRRFADDAKRPLRGWVRAIREALGMTTAQLAGRMGVKQPRIVELERAEAAGAITVRSLERAAEALGCRLVYILVPERPLTETLTLRAETLADQQLAAVDQTMRLEDQGVTDKPRLLQIRRKMVSDLLHRPARLWDAP